MVFCVAFNCTNASKKGEGISFFRFPREDPMRLIWTSKIGRKDFKPSVHSRVCSDHFQIDAYDREPDALAKLGYPNARPILKINAVPTLFNFTDEVDGKKSPKKESTKPASFGAIENPDAGHNRLKLSPTQSRMEAGAKYRISTSIDLDSIIKATIASISDPEKCTESAEFHKKLAQYNTQLRSIERKQRETTRLVNVCEAQIQTCKDDLEEFDKTEEVKYDAIKEIASIAAGQPHEITIIDSCDEETTTEDDDDVQFIQKTYDPTAVRGAIKRYGQELLEEQQQRKQQKEQKKVQQQQQQEHTKQQQQQQQPEGQQQQRQSNTPDSKAQGKGSTLETLRAALSATLKKSVSKGQVSQPITATNHAPAKPPASSTSSPIQSARARLQATINKELGGKSQSAPKTPKTTSEDEASAPSTMQSPPPLLRRPMTGNPANTAYMTSSAANQEKMERAFFEDTKKITEKCEILAVKHNDVWEKGTVVDINFRLMPLEMRKYKVRFENKKMAKSLNSKQIAFATHINRPVLVGTRIVALYKDDETDSSYYAGIIAEAPNSRNELRYLVFFDDGYAQYCGSSDIHKVFLQSKNVWEDIAADSQDFTRDYLAQYPERPMVRLHKGQTVKTEWKGIWWTAKVVEVDASLVQMYFAADKRSEWIYRGSTRLEPLYTALTNAEANRNAGRGKRHNLQASGSKKPVVEYTRNSSTDDQNKDKAKLKEPPLAQPLPLPQPLPKPAGSPEKKKRSVARKSCTGRLAVEEKIKSSNQIKNEAPKFTPPATPVSSNRTGSSKKDIASVLQDRLSTPDDQSRTAGSTGRIDEDSLGERCNQLLKLPVKENNSKIFVKHNCSPKCSTATVEDMDKFKGYNPLLVPIYCGWERHVTKAKPYGKRSVFYRSPCSRRLRTIEELDKYQFLTECQLTIDYFCFDSELHVHYEFIPVKTFCDIKDISYGKEKVAISCVNGIDRQYPDYVDYSNQRIPASGVKLNLDPEFLCGCDCTDGCRDKSKCACQQLSVEASGVINGGKSNTNSGYQNRRLKEPILSGIYECNARCKCDRRCVNRVVQNGLQNRLQVFKTEKRGWGLRCLDDIPQGGFICIYAGQLLTDQGANEDGQQYGDEYLAELDYIEVVERFKEGYESDVTNLTSSEEEEEEESDDEHHGNASGDSSFSDKHGEIPEKKHSTRSVKLRRDSDTADWVKGTPSPSGELDDLPDLDLPPTPDKKKVGGPSSEDKKSKKRTGRSTAARFGNLNLSKETDKDESKKIVEHRPGTRSYFHDSQSCYIMDAKSMGNIGRYLNHSCMPCAFVQNVFVDVHDLRFPWVAFFAGQYISAGTELTWDYNYEVGSVPGKVLYCYCGSADCRGRLL